MLLFIVALVVFAVLSVLFMFEPVNRFFSHIWMDPRELHRQRLLKEFHDLNVTGNMPAETALMMLSVNQRTSEQELLNIFELGSASEIKGILTGKQHPLSAIVQHIEKHIKKGTRGKRKR